ncbi:MAG: hypothetical protein AUG14_13065 [Candidatus Rokubacteria bacterium 13_1_20CM_2_68_19]|nr:MAG: hypothetical protein AUI04_03680 [Candidatus Rokubacteria bacterium 13_2_20CM_2_64_8]OLD31004.1 MAG: hypothetical protein AUI49_07655 [Candidatus Rokubacteria bacterium 13_1_40CM_2_68_13]OLE42205.1 MAG: hypothetical protein AUG14_13065 [Candidatus Rokubacteria bacterium 13_1_20CM_2_68_19]
MRFFAEQSPFFVEPVQRAVRHEREGSSLLDEDRHPVGQLADDVGAQDLGHGLQACGDGGRVDAEDVGAGGNPGGLDHALGRHPRHAAHLDAGDGESRRREEPAHPTGDATPTSDDDDRDRQPPPCCRPSGPRPGGASRPSGGAADLLARDERRALAHVTQPRRLPSGRQQPVTHR